MVDTIISIKKIKQSWTRYGGADKGLLSRTPEWVCQACGEQQPESIDSYLFPIGVREMIRLCPRCQNVVNVNNIISLRELISFVRRPHEKFGTIVIIAKSKRS